MIFDLIVIYIWFNSQWYLILLSMRFRQYIIVIWIECRWLYDQTSMRISYGYTLIGGHRYCVFWRNPHASFPLFHNQILPKHAPALIVTHGYFVLPFGKVCRYFKMVHELVTTDFTSLLPQITQIFTDYLIFNLLDGSSTRPLQRSTPYALRF